MAREAATTVAGVFGCKQAAATQAPRGDNGSLEGLWAGRPHTGLLTPALSPLQLGAEGWERGGCACAGGAVYAQPSQTATINYLISKPRVAVLLGTYLASHSTGELCVSLTKSKGPPDAA